MIQRGTRTAREAVLVNDMHIQVLLLEEYHPLWSRPWRRSPCGFCCMRDFNVKPRALGGAL